MTYKHMLCVCRDLIVLFEFDSVNAAQCDNLNRHGLKRVFTQQPYLHRNRSKTRSHACLQGPGSVAGVAAPAGVRVFAAGLDNVIPGTPLLVLPAAGVAPAEAADAVKHRTPDASQPQLMHVPKVGPFWPYHSLPPASMTVHAWLRPTAIQQPSF